MIILPNNQLGKLIKNIDNLDPSLGILTRLGRVEESEFQ